MTGYYWILSPWPRISHLTWMSFLLSQEAVPELGLGFIAVVLCLVSTLKSSDGKVFLKVRGAQSFNGKKDRQDADLPISCGPWHTLNKFIPPG